MTSPVDPKETAAKSLGLVRRFYLVGHPAWPDPLLIWPSTPEKANEYHEKYVVEFPSSIASHLRPEDYKPRVMWRWHHESMQPWPEPKYEPGSRPAYDRAVADCPEPYWHETHRYCPVCPWTEDGPSENFGKVDSRV